MPELPEVESTRRSIESHVVGRTIVRVDRGLFAGSVVHGSGDDESLLVGSQISCLARQGKELAIIAQSGVPGRSISTTDEGRLTCENSDTSPLGERVVIVHLGMSGSLRHGVIGEQAGDTSRTFEQAITVMGEPDRHTHITWHLDDGSAMAFRDPRRFGGLTTITGCDGLLTRWKARGDDALGITPHRLQKRLTATRRPIKSALLDQQVIAGLGNIYVDELLFLTRVHPLTAACDLDRRVVASLVRRMQTLLRRSIKSGGSSLRDYVNAQGESGGFQQKHKVYGRSGKRCGRCRSNLETLIVAGRTTVCCPACQVR